MVEHPEEAEEFYRELGAQGLRCKKRLWREGGRGQLKAYVLAPGASERRRDLLELLVRLTLAMSERNPGGGAGSGEGSRGAAIANTSRGGTTDGAGLHTGLGESGWVSVWQAGGELSGKSLPRSYSVVSQAPK
jgi:hypothetical protein